MQYTYNMKKVLLIIAIIFIVLFAIIAIPVGITASIAKHTYNSLTTERNAAQEQNSIILVELQRRYDLLNETVGTVKGALSHETTVYKYIAEAQAAAQSFNQAQSSGNTQSELSAGAGLTTALRGYLVVQQQYPQLQALQNTKDLQTNIDGSENRVGIARQRYDEDVLQYNNDLAIFPNNVLAGYFHFTALPYYKNDAESNKAPKIDLGQ